MTERSTTATDPLWLAYRAYALSADGAGSSHPSVVQRLVEAVRDRLAVTEGSDSRAPHPDTPHEFRTVCQRCGENGYLHVALITDLEVVKVETRAALDRSAE